MGLKAAADRLAVMLATGLYLSYIPLKLFEVLRFPRLRIGTGAGLIGTIEGLLVTPVLPEGSIRFSFFLIAAALLSCWLCGRAEKVLGNHDDSRIVLDEMAGFLPRNPWTLGAAFVLFRILDSLKPWPVRRLENLPGGLGVVADDLGAGIYANLLVYPLLPWLTS